MKYKLLIIISITTALSSCVFSGSEKIRTKEQTINALIGGWKPKNSSSDISAIIFIDTTNYMVFYNAKDGDLAQVTGTWSCEDAGTAHLIIRNKADTITINSDREMIMGKSEAFEKQGNAHNWKISCCSF